MISLQRKSENFRFGRIGSPSVKYYHVKIKLNIDVTTTSDFSYLPKKSMISPRYHVNESTEVFLRIYRKMTSTQLILGMRFFEQISLANCLKHLATLGTISLPLVHISYNCTQSTKLYRV